MNKENEMVVVKREIFILLRIVTSCLTAMAMIFFISALSGEDLLNNNDEINKLGALTYQINSELDIGVNQRIEQLGDVPEKNPFRKFYCIELAKEIHELSSLTEKQKMIFDTYDVRSFEDQLKRMMQQTEDSDVKSLMNEMEIVRLELKNSSNLLEKRQLKLKRQRTAYIVFFIVFWIVFYLYYGRGIIIKKNDYD